MLSVKKYRDNPAIQYLSLGGPVDRAQDSRARRRRVEPPPRPLFPSPAGNLEKFDFWQFANYGSYPRYTTFLSVCKKLYVCKI